MIFRNLKEMGILGINNRVGRYILRHNPRKNYPLVDNKVLTAQRAEAWGIATPENYMVVENYGSLKNLHLKLQQYESFVIKPANGSQGNGIIVFKEIVKEEKNGETHIYCRRSNDKLMDIEEVKHHISGILSGLYSLSGHSDTAIIQAKIDKHPIFDQYSYGGIPDIRVIVFEGFPVMSMVRLPTKSSDGKANLHQGAIGAGLNLSNGWTNNAVIRNQVVDTHPDTGHQLMGLKLPFWPEILELAARCYDMVELGYLGADIVLTPDRGPILLELNARPGLGIQIANLAGLVPRLEKIRLEAPKNLLAKERAEFSMKHF
ncbi:alpha-L-glutamate ligase-like protein [Peredibacter starrii]|uniref:Alpha-L-glutamate ligase-like protein n=1 Tax=Peredibacter starrii TaxID=28202 RepID=A0AAX4HS71_9BACT|nr:alpha-L-glutamate ligase-like protein [Peredibacter starrii]WPU66035.1 alpha-L-glutamate ligase-like protein [Peredibacter starrii]